VLKGTVDLVALLGPRDGIREAVWLILSGVQVTLTDHQGHLLSGIGWQLLAL
jgi:hypothetical protein